MNQINQTVKRYIEIKDENGLTRSSFDGQENDFIQTEKTQEKELLSPSFSDEILLSPSLATEQQFELEVQTQKQTRKRLRSRIRRFFASYYEISTAASLLRQRVIFLLAIFVCAKVAFENQKTEKVIPILFGASYLCLSYQIFENFIQCRYLKTADSGSQKMECMFEMADKVLLMFFASSLNLQYYGVINQIFLLLTPLFFLLELTIYWKNFSSTEAQDRDDMKIVEKAFYLLQSLMIAAKMNNLIDLKWETTLIFLWIYLGTHAACVILTTLVLGLVVASSILNFDIETLGILKNKILGYIWHISFFGLNVIGVIILTGIFEKIESNKNETIQLGLLYTKRLSLFLLIFTAPLFPVLKRFKIRPFEDLRITLQNHAISGPPQKKYTLLKSENERRIAFFSMASATYFNLLTDFSQEKFKEIISQELEDPKEENLCYICENKEANAILSECGHGGVCCDCAVKLIERKNECMGCRKPAKAIYKIENKKSMDEAEVIVQASELVQIIEV